MPVKRCKLSIVPDSKRDRSNGLPQPHCSLRYCREQSNKKRLKDAINYFYRRTRVAVNKTATAEQYIPYNQD
jgi:hypothetical protein